MFFCFILLKTEDQGDRQFNLLQQRCSLPPFFKYLLWNGHLQQNFIRGALGKGPRVRDHTWKDVEREKTNQLQAKTNNCSGRKNSNGEWGQAHLEMFRQLGKDIRLKIRWKILVLLTKIKVWGDPKRKENSQVLESHKKYFKIQKYARKNC